MSQTFKRERNLGYDGVDFVKATFVSDAMDCTTQSNCRRQKFSQWAKVLAIAPQSANECEVLVMLILDGASTMALLSLDFSKKMYSNEV